MSFQTILEVQQSLGVNNRRTVGQQVSRSGQVREAQYLTAVPWVFTVVPHNYLSYATSRQIIQTIDNLDRQLPETITFNTTNLRWFTSYQGGATTTPTTITLAATPAVNSQTLQLANVPASTGAVFKAGDFIMIGGYTYKITTDAFVAGSLATVLIHRPVIGFPVAGDAVACGNNCTFTVLAEKCPTYTLTPSPGSAFVNWDDAFVFREDIPG
jgi:hypothetical protein